MQLKNVIFLTITKSPDPPQVTSRAVNIAAKHVVMNSSSNSTLQSKKHEGFGSAGKRKRERILRKNPQLRPLPEVSEIHQQNPEYEKDPKLWFIKDIILWLNANKLHAYTSKLRLVSLLDIILCKDYLKRDR